jgi:hypothetical protein
MIIYPIMKVFLNKRVNKPGNGDLALCVTIIL